jgi:hypothetical protein
LFLSPDRADSEEAHFSSLRPAVLYYVAHKYFLFAVQRAEVHLIISG